MKLDIQRTIINKPFVVRQMIRIAATSWLIKNDSTDSARAAAEGLMQWNQWLEEARKADPDIPEEDFARMLKSRLQTQDPWREIMENEEREIQNNRVPKHS